LALDELALTYLLKLKQLKMYVRAKNFTHRLYRSISSYFGAIYSWNVCQSQG